VAPAALAVASVTKATLAVVVVLRLGVGIAATRRGLGVAAFKRVGRGLAPNVLEPVFFFSYSYKHE
jgi:hypothetical protein